MVKYILKVMILVSLLFFLCVVIIPSIVWPKQDGIVLNARFSLNLARRDIELFKKEKGRAPYSLSELSNWRESITDLNEFNPGFRFGIHKERLSSRHGNSKEYTELNNKGGFYYNNQTGEVKLNLTKPLKEYFIFIYVRSNKDEIPADW